MQAFPSVSTGIYGYPIEEATRIALEETRQYLDAETEGGLGVKVCSRSGVVFTRCPYEYYLNSLSG